MGCKCCIPFKGNAANRRPSMDIHLSELDELNQQNKIQ